MKAAARSRGTIWSTGAGWPRNSGSSTRACTRGCSRSSTTYESRKGSRRSLLDLDQLQRLAARALDHHRPCAAELVGLLEKLHALAAQLRHPRVEIGHAESDVIVEVASRGRERRRALIH